MKPWSIPLATGLLLSALAFSPPPWSPIAAATAQPDQAARHGKAEAGRPMGAGKGGAARGGGGHPADGRPGGKRADAAAGRSADYWRRDWDAEAFLAAGFTAAALRGLLGTQTHVLHTGARPLPPGIAKNLRRGKPLPPGIARQQPGGALAAALPRVSGHRWLEVGTDLVLVEAGTLIVADIVRGALD